MDAAREVPLRHETQQLQRGETEHAKHQVAHRPDRSAHPYGPTAMVVFQSAVDPLGRAAFTVANLFRHAISSPRGNCRFAFLRQFLLQPRSLADLVSMIGNMIELAVARSQISATS